FAFSNETGRNYSLLPMYLLRGHSTEMTITFLRDGKAATKKVNRYTQAYGMASLAALYTNRSASKELSPGIGYILNAKITSQEEADSLYKAMANYKAIIYDLRPIPDHTLRWHTAHLLSEPTPFFNATYLKTSMPGTFNWQTSDDAATHTGPASNPTPFQGKVYILVGPYTFSVAEFTTMALKTAPGAKVIGSQTAGADGDIKRIMLPGGITTTMSGIGIYHPDRGQTQRVGIVPDVEINLTPEDFKPGVDKVLQRAVELAEREISGM
ncbi:MAG: hypothetical protein LPK09_00220, partial [Hymenobacteraceae bacterium]|nr:hypothetical protein [Hymenobacteraceae bacterium]